MATGRYGSIPELCLSNGTNHACRQARLAPNARCRLGCESMEALGRLRQAPAVNVEQAEPIMIVFELAAGLGPEARRAIR